MSHFFHDLLLDLDSDLPEKLQQMVPNYGSHRILKQSVDARRGHTPKFVYSVEVAEKGELLASSEFVLDEIKSNERPIVIGAGPAGLFCALRLLERGIPCRLFERGSQAEKRIQGINKFWRYGTLDPRNNVCFGEGGAGLYSDGKLITRIKSDYIPYVLKRLVQFGCPPEIEYLANPHVGSDKLRRCIPAIRNFLISRGCEIYFDTQITEILTEQNKIIGVKTEYNTIFNSPFVVLATGHSANDIFAHLKKLGVFMEGKSFAVGLRIEHPQKLINQIQYREWANHPKLGAANYKLAFHDKKENVGVYSFCMCPGGYVLSCGTEANGLVSNGMSNYQRNSPYANAALVVTIDHEKTFKTENIFGGLNYRKELETKAYLNVQKAGGNKHLPAQKLFDFLDQKTGPLNAVSSPSGAVPVRLDRLLDSFIYEKIRKGLEHFQKNMRDYVNEQAQLFGVETRTSCPVRITRDAKTLQSISHEGLYPTGEGAGYAGGITSAACDGVRIAESIFMLLKNTATSELEKMKN
jgi:uncharacterized FAD-dependent dehydrogenase